MVTREQLEQFLRRRPFQPFRVHVLDGRTFDIRYPELNLLGPSYLSIGIPAADEPELFADRVSTFGLTHITKVEPLPAAESTANP
jgi:hypothetical protein